MITFISPVRVNGPAASLQKGRGRDENHVTKKQEINRQGVVLLL